MGGNRLFMRRRKGTISVLGHHEWDRAGRALARLDRGAYRRLLIAARSIVAMHEAGEDEDVDAILAATMPMLDSTDEMVS